MISVKPLSRKYGILFITGALLAVAMCYYFFVQVPAKQHQVIDRNYRALDKVTRNIKERLDTYSTISGTIVNSAGKTFNTSVNAEDSVRAYLKSDNNFPVTIEIAKVRDSVSTGKKISVSHSQVIFSDTVRLKDIKYEYTAVISADSFFTPSLNSYIFSDYLILDGENVIYGNIPGGKIEGQLDTLFRTARGIQTGGVKEVVTGGKSFYLFIQPLAAGDKVWTVCGIVPSGKIIKESRSISPIYIVVFFLLGLFFILGLPFIKTLLISPTERINRSDMIFAAISLLTITCVMTFLLHDAYAFTRWGDAEVTDKNLEDLSDSITGKFEKEVHAACGIIRNYDSQVCDKCYDIVVDGHQGSHKKGTVNFPAAGIDYNSVYWIDDKGEEQITWTKEKDTVFGGNYSQREYFDRIRKGDYYIWGKDSFMLQSITSWKTGEARAVVSMRSLYRKAGAHSPLLVTALSMPMKSVIDPILPAGFGFCIIDDKGKTLFHSDSKRNQLENLVEECAMDKSLQAAIYSRTRQFLTTMYQGKEHRMRISPIGTLPLYMVTFRDRNDVYTIHAQVFSLTTICIAAFLLFTLSLIAYYSWAGRNYTEHRESDSWFSWLVPSLHKRPVYLRITIFNLVLASLMVIAGTDCNDPLYIIFLLFITCIYGSTYSYLAIIVKDLPDVSGFRKLIHITWKYGLVIIPATIAIIVLTYVSAPKINEDNYTRLIVFHSAVGVLLLFFCLLPNSSAKRFMGLRIDTTESSKTIYILCVLSWLILACILPTMKLFQASYNEEKRRFIHYVHLDLLKNRQAHQQEDHTVYAGFFGNTHAGDAPSSAEIEKGTSRGHENFSRFVSSLRPLYNMVSVKGNYLMEGVPRDSSQNRWYDLKEHVIFAGSGLPQAKPLYLKTDLKAFTFPRTRPGGYIFWIIASLLLVGLFYVLRFFANRFFFTADDKLRLAETDKLIKDGSTKALFVTGLPYSGKSEFIQSALKDRSDWLLIDLVQPLNSRECRLKIQNAEVSTILIDHFEYNVFDDENNNERLNLIETILSTQGKRLIVMSTLSPEQIVAAKKNNTASAQGDRWENLMINFAFAYFPLQGYPLAEMASMDKYIAEECRHSWFLRKMAPDLQPIGHEYTHKEAALKVQQLAHNYYNGIWNALSLEEKYIVYDLAQDELVNVRSTHTISTLLHKGLIIQKESRLRPLNESFRNFVLSEVKKEEAVSIEVRANEGGTWTKFRQPVFLVLITLLVFVFTTQENTFDSTLAYITSFTAGMPVVLRLITLIGSGKEVKE